LDISDPGIVDRALAQVEADILVNNAGVAYIKPLLDLSIEEWHQMAAVNFNALFYITRALLPAMIRRRRGHILTVGSLAGRNPLVGGTGYAGTKHAVIGFTESLMLEVRQYNVRVSTIMPGSVATGLRTGAPLLGDTSDAGWMVTPEQIAEAVVYIIQQPENTLVSRVEIRPAMPPKR
jgi:3-oxoacyl-[acyl-carrier protein] reductase